MLDVLIPLKTLSGGKTRLRTVLPAGHRMALVNAMARDVIQRVALREEVARVLVIVGRGWDRQTLSALGAEVIPESELPGADGLNASLAAAAQRCTAERIAIVHGDLPFIRGNELAGLNQALDTCERVFCPDDNGVGTNALAFRVDSVPQLVFGEGSFSRFCNMAEEAATRWCVHAPDGLIRDIDDPEDLSRLLQAVAAGQLPAGHTRRWVRQLAWTPVLSPDVLSSPPGRGLVWDREAAR